MPRLTSLRVAALEDLARQLRYVPRDTLRRQLQRIEALAAEIDPAINYPEDWVVFRVTGYRPDIAEPATFVGEALLGDLSPLVERLSEEAEFTTADLPEGALSLDELAERWSVSRKSIERYRRQGLVAHRVQDESGRVRLAFTPEAVAAFEARRAGDLSRAARFHRISAADEASIYVEALRLRARFGWPLTRLASELAARHGRSREAVRQLLIRLDAESTSPAFKSRPQLTPRQRRAIDRAYRWGVDPAHIAERYARSAATVHRIVNQRRAAALRRFDLDGPMSPAFTAPDAAEKFLAHDCLKADLLVEPEAAASEFIAAARAEPIPNRFVEHTLAAAHHFLRWRAGAALEALSRNAPNSLELDRIETDLRAAALLREALVRTQRRLALQSIEGRFGDLLELPPETIRRIHALVMDALIEATDSFDPFKGGRLAAP
ncbi:MAG: hypothetical protein VYC34_05900, partial [Planctomycetota bacterium]|nr:hypothetical protein [Planctomycetota bacterium]